jgi:hypothetical protein
MVSKQQIADEQRKEREYNKLFEQVISKSPFGQWYGLMIGASNLLTQNLPKSVGIDQDGRPMVVYKGDVNKLLGVWATPTHKVIAQDLSQQKYGKALGDLLGIGQITETIKQKRAKFFDISPEEVTQIRNSKIQQSKQPKNTVVLKTDNELNLSKNKFIHKTKRNYTPFIIVSVIGIIGMITVIKYRKFIF